jgi:arylsulfate sulfotransferase
MQIKWILGPHDNWNARFQPYLLTPVGEPFEWPWSQHHATLYGPHLAGENIVNILLFDNSIYRSFDFANAQSPLDWYSRVVHYRIDETAMTIEQVWEYGQERSAEIFAFNRGSAYLLPNGNVLGTWGAIAKDARGNPVARTPLTVSYETKFIEVDPMNSEVIFECTLPSTWTYRALRAGFYDGYSETSESNSSALKDHTRNDLVDRSMIVWQDILRWSYNDPMMLSLRRFARQILSSIR